MPHQPEISEEVLNEGCYYLSQLGLSNEDIAKHFGLTSAEVRGHIDTYTRQLKTGDVVQGDFDRTFWKEVKKEAEGDVKVTFLSDKGFHHAWKSELMKLDGTALMAIYESSKAFMDTDQNRRFLDYPVPKGYDPLALDREMRKAVEIIGELLQDKWRELKETGRKRPKKDTTT